MAGHGLLAPLAEAAEGFGGEAEDLLEGAREVEGMQLLAYRLMGRIDSRPSSSLGMIQGPPHLIGGAGFFRASVRWVEREWNR